MTSKPGILNQYSVLTAAFLLFAGSMGAARAQDANAPTPPAIDSGIVLTAVDKNRRFVTSLKAEDLRILEDGVPQKIAALNQLTDRTVSLAILIDTSSSQERTLPAQKIAATSFVNSAIRPGRDQAAVATFSATLTVEQMLTNNVNLLREAIARVKFLPPPGYVRGGLVIGPPPKRTPAALAMTAIWDNVIAACNDLLSASLPQTRRAIVLITDGMDSVSRNKMAAAIERSIQDNVVIYSIGIGETDSHLYSIDKDSLRKLSERTGGHAFFPKKMGELAIIFAEIAQELRSQYLLVYKSNRKTQAPGKIRVELVNPALRNANAQLYYQQFTPRK